MRSAIIKDGIVTNVIVGSISGSIECPAEVCKGWSYDGQSFAPPLPKPDTRTVDEARHEAVNRVHRGHRTALAELVERFPQTERDGWHELVKDAEFGGGDCIQAYATGLDVTVPEAATRILKARDAYRKAYGKATGTLTKLRDEIDAAETVEALDAINWPKV